VSVILSSFCSVGLLTDHKDNVGDGFAADGGITEYATQESII
jgi:hypothetical protein